jgi:hypothetical protein
MESWKDKQPKVKDLSEVVEVVQERSARRDAFRPKGRPRDLRVHNSSDCLMTIAGNQIALGLALEFVTELVLEERLAITFEGQFLADRVARLIDACTLHVVQATSTGSIHKRFPKSTSLVPRAAGSRAHEMPRDV